MKNTSNRVTEVKNQRKELQSQLDQLNRDLKINLQYQQSQILANRDASRFETEIVRLQTKIQGITAALGSLDALLLELHQENSQESHAKLLEDIQGAKSECFELTAEIYQNLVAVIEKIQVLAVKYKVYKKLAAGAGHEQEWVSLRRLSNLVTFFKNNLPKLMAAFPAEIYSAGTSPAPKKLTELLRIL